MAPASKPRGRARRASMTPYYHVNAIKNIHPNLQEIIKNCPALDVILAHDNPRGSTHNRGRARDKEHVARPPNAFMVYRSYVWYTKQLEDNDEKNLSCVSRQAGRSWTVMDDQARAPFKQVADIAKRLHAERNPDYKYAPSSRSHKSQKKPARRVSRAKVKGRVKESATHRNVHFDAWPHSKETTPTPASTSPATSVDTPPVSSEFSCSCSSSSSPSSRSASPASMPRQWALNLPSPSLELRYPCDCDHPAHPPQPRVRPVTSGLIPSPSMSVLHLNDAHTSSVLDELPDKYKEAESYHNLQPHAFLFNKRIPFYGVEPNAQITVQSAPAETINYSNYISGDPEVNLGSPDLDRSPIGGCFSSGPSTTTNDDFNSSSAVNWSVFDIPTLDFDHSIVDERNMYGPNDDLFDAVITSGGY